MATIATHNGSGASRGHNLRKEEIVSKEKHIDPEGIHETWFDVAPRQAYEQIFGKAVEEYNAQQTRADRKITNYYNDVRADQRRHVGYEMIIGIYPKEGEAVPDALGKNVLREFVASWQERNPNLTMTGAYYHADEQGRAPHVHIDYIPVAHGYKRGPAVQNGLVKALGEMGFDGRGKNTAQIQWERRENEYLETLCNRRGISVEHPQEGKGVKHLHTETYKANQDLQELKDDIKSHEVMEEHYKSRVSLLSSRREQLSAEVKALHADITTLQNEKNNLNSSVITLQLEQQQARSRIDFYNKLAESKQKELEQLKEEYRELESRPPIQKVVEVKKEVEVPQYVRVEVPVKVEKVVEVPKYIDTPRYIDTPVKRYIDVPREVITEKVVEVEKNYKNMAEKALNAFRLQSEWLQSKGLSVESYNDLSHDLDYLQTNKTVYPRNRARVSPLHPDLLLDKMPGLNQPKTR